MNQLENNSLVEDSTTNTINMFTLIVVNFLKVTFVLSLILNTVTIISILLMKNYNQINVLILNLSVADLIHTTGIPLFIFQTLDEEYDVGLIGCKIFFLNDFIGMIVITLTVTALSIERFFKVADTCRQAKSCSSSQRVYLLIAYLAFSWSVGVLFPLPFILSLEQELDDGVICYTNWSMNTINIFFGLKFVLIFALPYTLISIASTKLLFFLHRWLKRIKQENWILSEFETSEKMPINHQLKFKNLKCTNKRIKIQRKSSRTVLMIVFLFLIQWMPLWLMQLIISLNYNHANIKYLILLSTTLTYTNSVSNPILYMLNTYNFKSFCQKAWTH